MIIVNILMFIGCLDWLSLVMASIVDQSCAKNNSSTTQKVPFSNNSKQQFSNCKNERQLFKHFKIETGIVQEKIHVLFSVGANLKGNLNCPKIDPEIGQFFSIFKHKRQIVIPSIST